MSSITEKVWTFPITGRSSIRKRARDAGYAGCGLCVKRCPMDAIQLVASDEAKNKTGKISVLEPDLCIGCGVCAFKCPTDSITLEKREEITEPPADTREYVNRFINDFSNPLPKRKV
ncbi:MAG: 4Fe-4S dicluster domain-containing protein [Deltaproteobacteria bacterium]|nr:4Fe-4S dicluster domain-containing protein [Deltaproteobacteria bacterium]